jgi:hypothetical protein
MSEKFSTKRLIDAISAGMLRHAEEDAIIARLRAADNLKNKSLMKLAADLGVSFSAAKILEDHVRAEYDAKLRTADALCKAAERARKDFDRVNELAKLAGVHPFTLTPKDLDKAIADYEKGDMT